MELGDAARGARRDQAHAAQADVVDILAMVARERQRWSRADERTYARIDALLEGLFADGCDPAHVCPHARPAAFDRAPRPLVLDSWRGILACWEACYWRAITSEAPGRRPDATCFECGRPLGGAAGGSDLFIAYGPILVVGALCQQCQDVAPDRSIG
jgi:hypothetical protein